MKRDESRERAHVHDEHPHNHGSPQRAHRITRNDRRPTPAARAYRRRTRSQIRNTKRVKTGQNTWKSANRDHTRDRCARHDNTKQSSRTQHATHGEAQQAPQTAPQLHADADADLKQPRIVPNRDSTTQQPNPNQPEPTQTDSTQLTRNTDTQITPVDNKSRRKRRAFCRSSAHRVDSLTPVLRSAVEPDRRKAETTQPRLKQTHLSHNPSHQQLWRQSSATVTETPKPPTLKQSQPTTTEAAVKTTQTPQTNTTQTNTTQTTNNPNNPPYAATKTISTPVLHGNTRRPAAIWLCAKPDRSSANNSRRII